MNTQIEGFSTEITPDRYTYKDYLLIDDDKRYEVLRGGLIMVPAPLTIHQRVSINLASAIQKFVKGKKLGDLFYAPTDVVLSEDIVVQPDILFIDKERTDIIEEAAIMGSPDLIVEIVSPSSASYDTVEKRDIYEEYGVKEYWLVFPQEKVIEVLTLEGSIYREFCKGRKTGVVKSKIINGLEVDLKEVFES
ncbi:MAG: Uma2 family endonuclease [Nitrospinae bacterium]|nr:Uma2 family endonuclease [Nitrospinota bacterium]